jgi:hypothetical protein
LNPTFRNWLYCNASFAPDKLCLATRHAVCSAITETVYRLAPCSLQTELMKYSCHKAELGEGGGEPPSHSAQPSHCKLRLLWRHSQKQLGSPAGCACQCESILLLHCNGTVGLKAGTDADTGARAYKLSQEQVAFETFITTQHIAASDDTRRFRKADWLQGAELSQSA